MKLRLCNKCQNELPGTPENFHRHARCRDGLGNICKPCRAKQQQAYQRANSGINFPKSAQARACRKYALKQGLIMLVGREVAERILKLDSYAIP